MSDVLFLYDDTEKYPNEILLCDCFFDCGLQLIKGKKKNVRICGICDNNKINYNRKDNWFWL